MNDNIAISVSMLCEQTPEILFTIQASVSTFIALCGYSAEEVMSDENLTDALNSYVNNELVSEMDLKYGSVIINLVYKK
ncbi:hypothetical protein [Yersinia enterocolitica]|uniref:hypothetical protein n=1 Tax=Yersinia enterocolitica TaxID=630 RepID=UPI00227CFAEA|nr:hypothetical protein [Yersinia enterocolitica]MCY1686777.1 hypothetical protein [Yersinia enterocolitica]